MTKPDIHLNDFGSFDRYLFGDGDVDWEKFSHWRNVGWIFTPPILRPISKVEYQLDHYALWMTIAHNNPLIKPIFSDNAVRPYSRCYACQYKRDKYGVNKYCLRYCPLINVEAFYCIKPYREWGDTDDEDYAAQQAEIIARIPWREII